MKPTIPKFIAPFILACLLASCATVDKEWIATGGSRADGVVRLSFETHAFEKAQLDESQGVATAASRCKVWGYNGAEAFGGSTKNCQRRSAFGDCTQWMVTKEYQCLNPGSIAK